MALEIAEASVLGEWMLNMDIASKSLCMGCMSPLPEDAAKCPKCGYSKQLPYNVEYLPPASMVGKYLIGKMLLANGESAVYIGFDTETESKVWIREFMPTGVASRNHATQDVMPNPGKEALYKYFMASFEDLYQTLQKWNGQEGCIPVIELAYFHNTVYAVEKYMETVTLGEYLKENGGELPWTAARKMLLPLFNCVANLHAKGVLHLGITPEHILVNEKNQLFLSSFSILEARMENQDLYAETFEGYSAPEQYDPQGQITTATDVYALGAVTYRVLTGTRPAEAAARLQEDTMVPAIELNPTVPESISDAVSAAMVADVSFRVETVDEFTSQLLESVSGNTAVYGVGEDTPNENTVHLEPSQDKKKPFLYVGGAMAAAMLVLGAIAIVAYNMVIGGIKKPGEEEQPPAPEQETQETPEPEPPKTVPDLEGKLITTVTNNSAYMKEYQFQIKEEYSETYPEGIIISQQPKPGTPMVNKGTIVLTVSKGSESIALPDLVESNLDFAMKMLTEQKITYKVYIEENNDYPPGTVFRTEPVSGSMVKIDSPSPVLIYATPKEEEVEAQPDEEEEKEGKPKRVASKSSKDKDND